MKKKKSRKESGRSFKVKFRAASLIADMMMSWFLTIEFSLDFCFSAFHIDANLIRLSSLLEVAPGALMLIFSFSCASRRSFSNSLTGGAKNSLDNGKKKPNTHSTHRCVTR